MPNWSEIDEQYKGGQFKDYAPNGEHTAKLDSVKVVDNANWKSPAVEFIFLEDDTYKYPKSTRHFLSLAKPAWRAKHSRDILMAFGMAKENAEKAIDVAEKDQDRAKLVRAYQAIFDRVAQKHPEVEIIVRTQMRDGKPVCSSKGTPYSESELKKAPAPSGSSKPAKSAASATVAEEILGGDEINLTEIPF